MNSLDINQIKELLSQRYPLLMIDRILEIKFREKAIALKNVSVNEPYFQGHFPDSPVMPGALIVEAMAQTTVVFYVYGDKAIEESGKRLLLGSVKARFLKPVFPGDQMRIEVTPIKILSNGGLVKALAKVDDVIVCKGEIGFSVQDK